MELRGAVFGTYRQRAFRARGPDFELLARDRRAIDVALEDRAEARDQLDVRGEHP